MKSPDKNRLKVGLISNPNSGRNRKLLHKIEHIISEYDQVHHCITPTPEAVPSVLEEFAEQSVNLLAINGGDGTVAQVLSTLLLHSYFPSLPLIALLPGGTTNMNVGDIGIPGNLVKTVSVLCACSDNNHKRFRLRTRPILKVKPGDNAQALHGFFFGIGAIIQGIEYCHESLHSKGFGNELGPGLALARTVWGIIRKDSRFTQPVSATLAIDNNPVKHTESIQFLLVSSLERLFLGIRPYWGTEQGSLHFSMIRYNADRFLRTFPSLLRGRPNHNATIEAGYRSHNIEKLTMHMTGTFTLDGEMYHADDSTGAVTVDNGGELTFVQLPV